MRVCQWKLIWRLLPCPSHPCIRQTDFNLTFDYAADPSFASDCMEQTRGKNVDPVVTAGYNQFVKLFQISGHGILWFQDFRIHSFIRSKFSHKLIKCTPCFKLFAQTVVAIHVVREIPECWPLAIYLANFFFPLKYKVGCVWKLMCVYNSRREQYYNKLKW
jgi:hypothetical protein